MIELYKGLPIRTITAVDKNGVENIFNVTTDLVDKLVIDHLNYGDLDKDVVFFDDSYMYAVPQEVFENEDDEAVIDYIRENIDTDF